MTNQLSADPKDRIIVALDVDTPSKALQLVKELKPYVGSFKIGLELIFGIMASVVHSQDVGMREVLETQELFALLEGRVFLDCKLHDISRTVGKAAQIIASLNVRMFNVHASGGLGMMQQAKQDSLNMLKISDLQRAPLILGVTVLTGLDETDLVSIGMLPALQVKDKMEQSHAHGAAECVERLAKLTKAAGLDGIVCSAQETALIRRACGKDFVIVTPGIRPLGSDMNDQKRVGTPEGAIRAGADYIVVGRPITDSAEPVFAAIGIVKQVESALKEVA